MPTQNAKPKIDCGEVKSRISDKVAGHRDKVGMTKSQLRCHDRVQLQCLSLCFSYGRRADRIECQQVDIAD